VSGSCPTADIRVYIDISISIDISIDIYIIIPQTHVRIKVFLIGIVAGEAAVCSSLSTRRADGSEQKKDASCC